MNDNPLKYTCLFGGGAIRGMAYIGAIRAMEELNIEYDIIGGSSVGSIFATLLACGYKSYELENIFMKVNFELFKDIHFGFKKCFAISKGEIFIDWLNELISAKIFQNTSQKATFKDLNKELVIITTNLKEFNTQEFSKFTTPDFEIANAIRISSSMPGLMPPFQYNDASLVDGDLQKASPMWKLSESLNNNKSRILEYRLEGLCGKIENNPISFINTIYSCVTEVATNFVQDIYGKNDKFDCLKICTGDVFFADLNLDKNSRRKLISGGYEQTMHYFRNILPKKKEHLEEIYTLLLKYLRETYKGIKINNVEEVQWWLGDLFTVLCENKEFVNPLIVEKIIMLKNHLYSSITSAFFIYKHFKEHNLLANETKEVISDIENALDDIKLFIKQRPYIC